MKIIDFHTHIFPDKIAKQALDTLAAEFGDYRPCTDGTLKGLISSMDSAGIGMAVAANIATKPTHTGPILSFCKEIKGERIHPLISFHPLNKIAEVEDILARAEEMGIRGVKLHPMYQDFSIDDRKMYPYYELVEKFGMFIVFHTGFDMAFPGNTQADVERVKKVAEEFPNLTIVCTHLGGWKQWDRVKILTKRENIYTETSMVITETDENTFIKLLLKFDEDRVLFGTDSPWTDQKKMAAHAMGLPISDKKKEKLLFSNAAGLLGINK